MTPLRFIAIIPARYASTRFPGKPLAMLGGKTVIQRVYEQVSQAIENVIVATDDERILSHVTSFGGKAVMTSNQHRSGTDRCWEAYLKNGGNEDIIINVQGDEPFIHPEQIEALKMCFDDEATDIATLVKPFDRARTYDDLENPNSVKVVLNSNLNALYFSRSAIPHLRGIDKALWPSKHQYYTHLGIYAYRANVLERITNMEPSLLELAESLEQLRWLENGMTIKVGVTQHTSIGIDTPQDLERAEQFLNQQ
ncbi:MAG: 3-deoxy-manno-octulosonate cytidylyltransferase [Muribaculaceae bacterium]|nr:3-deoxy-manno-octulosonate cytidylyltransferase [Muribaculaceae bacterium]